MSRRQTDLAALRCALRRLPRGDLLMIAERATELVPETKLKALLGELVALKALVPASSAPVSILDEVRRFHAAGMSGQYYETFDVNAKNCTEKSKGTQAFIAEFDRLVRQCIRAAKTGPRPVTRQAFELLFDMLAEIDQGNDDIIFFADEGGSWDIGVNWRAVLPAYFRCLAEAAAAVEFAQRVDKVITRFCHYERPHHLKTARRIATGAQKAALQTP